MQHSDLPEGTRHPIILPRCHTVVEKIIQSVHKELLNAGPESTLLVLRQEIWLTNGRREVKRVLGKCFVCQRQQVGPCLQTMAPFPSERVSCIVFSLHSRWYRLCRAIFHTRECLLSEGLHLYLHLRLIPHDLPMSVPVTCRLMNSFRCLFV